MRQTAARTFRKTVRAARQAGNVPPCSRIAFRGPFDRPNKKSDACCSQLLPLLPLRQRRPDRRRALLLRPRFRHAA